MTRTHSRRWLPAPLVTGALAAASTTALATAEASATASPAVTATTPSCAWPQEVGAQATNVFFPDSAASYWVMPYTVSSDLRITVSGTFPDARYASFTVYGADRGTFTSNGVPSAIADYRIAPGPGSTNPWQQVAAPGGGFQLTLRMDVDPSQVDTLPLAPAGTADGAAGYLVYRVYAPTGGVSLPTLTLTQGGTSTTLTPCDAAQASASAAGAVVTAGTAADALPAAAADRAFARDTGTNSLFPNADNAYLSATVTPPGAGRVVLVRARAPRAVSGTHPTPWPAAAVDMRYWSLCTNLRYPARPVVVNHLPDGTVDYGCRYDDQAALDASGYVTFVLGTEAQRARIEAVDDVTFVPFSLSQPAAQHILLLRNMMPVDGFAEAVQNVPQDGDPASAAAVMGAYYPIVSTCALAVLAAQGIAGCLG